MVLEKSWEEVGLQVTRTHELLTGRMEVVSTTPLEEANLRAWPTCLHCPNHHHQRLEQNPE
jgi:hypothetical protein